MSKTPLARAAEIFASRLQTLGRLLDTAETQWRDKGADPKALLAGRLADDMHPLPYQVVFACNQANDLAAWCVGGEAPQIDPVIADLDQLKRHVQATIARLAQMAAEAEDQALARDKRVDLQGGAYLSLTGQEFVDDWLTPNFYFHLVTAYDVLRSLGVRIGKAEYMAHLSGRVRTS